MSKTYVKVIMIFGILCCFSVQALAAGDRSKVFNLKDYFDLETVREVQISPDGERIIYVRQFADIMSDKRYSNLWIINFDGSDHRPLTSGLYSDSSPRWSPDGSRIIFISDREGKPQIFKRWMDTGETVMLTNLIYPPSGISWSPEGQHIAFSSSVPSKPTSIIKTMSAPEGAEWAAPATVTDRAIYRFDGIGYSIGQGFRHLFVMPAEGGTPYQLSQGDFYHPFIFRSGAGGTWAPDSKSIVCSSNRREDWEYEVLDSEAYEFSIADGTMKALTKRKGPDNSPAISPDGKYLAYLGYDDRYQGYQLTKLYVSSRNGSNPREVLNDFDRSISSLEWGSDSQGIYFSYDDQGNTKLAITTLDGQRKVLAGDLARSFSVAQNGRFAFVTTLPDVPGDVAVGHRPGHQSAGSDGCEQRHLHL